ncbi:hypothetical protein L7F22_035088 [Adiantum nelumboides]|nr:hypothetical protein [Adiantum nelumboides]
METPVHLLETMQSPKPVPNGQEQVAKTRVFQAVPVQPATFQQPIAGSNGQGSNLLAMQQVFPPPSVHPGYFGGGSVFQSMAGHALGNQFYMPGTVFGGAQTMMPNPMYGSIGMQPGFQSTQGQFGMPQAILLIECVFLLGWGVFDQVRTIFVLGFPPDVKERELQNLLRWWPGYEASQMNFKGEQPMGFALFSSAVMALSARDALQNLVFDPDTNSVLRAEMAKKNLYVKRGKSSGLFDYKIATFDVQI